MSQTLQIIIPIISLAIGWALSELSNYFRRKDEWRRLRRQLEESYRQSIFRDRLLKYQEGLNIARVSVETLVKKELSEVDSSMSVNLSDVVEQDKKLEIWFYENRLWLSDGMREAVDGYLFPSPKKPSGWTPLQHRLTNYVRILETADRDFGTKVLHRPIIDSTLLAEAEKKNLITTGLK